MADEQNYEESVAKGAAKQREAAMALARAQGDLEKAQESGALKAEALPNHLKVYVAPVERNTRFLINPTERTFTVIKDPNSPTGERQTATHGDIWVEFHDAIAVIDTSTTEGKRQADWCAQHEEICRDADDPFTDAWATLKEGQLDKINAEPSIPRGLNIDAMLRGDPTAMRGGNKVVTRGREAARG